MNLKALIVALGVVAAACSSDEPPFPAAQQSPTPEITASTRAVIPSQSEWLAGRQLPPLASAASFGEPATVAPKPPAAPLVRPAEAILSPGPPAVPYAYVGKLTDGRNRYAVLARDQAVLIVKAGDAVGDVYQVQTIGETELRLLHVALGAVQVIAFRASAAPRGGASLSVFASGAQDEASLQIAGPRKVGVGEKFALTISLDTGAHSLLETGNVELRFDPKVLQVSDREAPNGVARLEISGAYMGHPAPVVVQFRVVAPAPTVTEIRIVPTNIADAEGRNVGVNAPSAHALQVVY